MALAAAALTLLAACNGPYDLTGSVGADHVYIDSAGAWRVLGTDEIIWTGPTVPVSDPGSTGRYAAPGNYDGEGRWEPAVVDVTTGVWTTAGGRGTFTFPAPADPSPGSPSETGDVVAVPGDYDGDGDTDPAYFVEDTATWHVEGQTPFEHGWHTQIITPWQASIHDIAAPADYDGDGDTDPAVYHPQNGDIEVLGESAPRRTNLPWGLPAPADYDGVPGAEASALGLLGQGWAVESEPVIPAFDEGDWTGARWVGPTGLPMPADYDGDGDIEKAHVEIMTTPAVMVEGAVVGNPSGQMAALPPWIANNDGPQPGSDCIWEIEMPCPGEDAYFLMSTLAAWLPFNVGTYPLLPFPTSPLGGIPVRGDYDGDGTAEPAVYLEATGEWATNGARGTVPFPAPPDIDTEPTTSVYPVPADYDGDGDTDPAFYRDADATWHIEGRSPVTHGRPTTTTPTFGPGTPIHDIPVPGDYDGDGDTDLATYRLDTGEHHIAGLAPTPTPWPTGEPAVADMDADGRDDLTIWDDADGTGVLHSVDGLRYYRYPTDRWTGTPVAGDWDGDGDREIATLGDEQLLLRLPGGAPVTSDSPYKMDPDHVDPITGQLVVTRPASGRWEVHANHDFVDSYVAACVTPSSPPASCP